MSTVGEIAALLAAVTWATSSLLVKALIRDVAPIPLTALRLSVGAIFVLLVLAVSRQLGSLGDLPPLAALGLIVSTIVGIGAGDSLYATSLKFLPMAIAFPLSMTSYLVVSFLVAMAFLGEPIGPYLALGLALTVVGIYLLTSPGRESHPLPGESRQKWKGLGIVLASALCWVISLALLKLSVGHSNLLVANAVRLPVAAIVLLGLTSQVDPGSLKLHRYGRSVWILIGAAGVLGYGIGTLFFLASVEYAGAARTALLSSVAPLFALPLSIVFLKEKVTAAIAVGTMLTVAGIVLVLLD